MKYLMPTVALCFGLASACAAQASLMSAMGGQVVNDTDLNVTWLADANLAATNTFGVSGILPDGRMTWHIAQSWIAAMNTANYLGYSDWRLPITLQPDLSCSGGGLAHGYFCTGSEMGHLFYIELGGTAGQSILASVDTDLVKFANMQSDYYWSDTEYAPYVNGGAWNFGIYGGAQTFDNTTVNLYALAVRPGQVAVVPEPGTAWLLGIGLLGLTSGVRRRLARVWHKFDR